MADVDNIQETVSPEPNPYNAKKSWHTEEVMPKEGISADSLFVAPKPETQEVSEGESVQQESQPKKENKPYQIQSNYFIIISQEDLIYGTINMLMRMRVRHSMR